MKPPTMAEVEASRRGRSFWKGTPPVVERRQKRAAKANAEDEFRKAVWARDGGVSRASGKPVLHAHLDPTKRGEVAHLKARSTAPGQKLDDRNGCLLTAEEHALSDARTANAGGRVLLEIKGRDGRKALTFIRRDVNGRELWRRVSLPPTGGR